MGWGRYFLLGDWGQQMDLSDQKRELEHLREELYRQRESVPHVSSAQYDQLKFENDELKLYVAALVRLMVAKKVATPEEINALVTVIDREDGTEDGRFSGPLTNRSNPRPKGR